MQSTCNSVMLLSILTLGLPGCVTYLETGSEAVKDIPEWFQARRIEASSEGFPNITAIPDLPQDDAPGAAIENRLPLTNRIEVDFETHPRAEPYLGGVPAITVLQSEILTLGFASIPAPAGQLTPKEIARINLLFDAEIAKPSLLPSD